MKVIKLFEEFNNHSEIDRICKDYSFRNYIINSDGSVDIDGNVDLRAIELTKIPLKFNNVSGYFDCSSNRLKSLIGSPIKVGKNFYCSYCDLTSLDGSPKEVGGMFDCSDNILTSLEGAPKITGIGFHCENNAITSFEGCPDRIGEMEYFTMEGNPIEDIWILFKDYSKIELFNDLDIIRDNKVIILDRLNDFLDMCGKKPVTKVEGYKCI